MQNSLTLTLSSSILSYCKNNHKFAELCFLTVSWRHPSVGGEGCSNLRANHPPPFPRTFHSLLPRRFYCPLRFGRPSSRSTALLRKLPLFSCMMDPKSGFFSRPILSKINLMFVIVFLLFCFVFVFVFVCF